MTAQEALAIGTNDAILDYFFDKSPEAYAAMRERGDLIHRFQMSTKATIANRRLTEVEAEDLHQRALAWEQSQT